MDSARAANNHFTADRAFKLQPDNVNPAQVIKYCGDFASVLMAKTMLYDTDELLVQVLVLDILNAATLW